MAHEPRRTAVYLRCLTAEDIAMAIRVGAHGVSLDLHLDDAGSVRVGPARLDELATLADSAGLALEFVAGAVLDSRPATSLIAATVATLVSSRSIQQAARLVSFDHAAITSMGASAGRISLGLRHLVTLHRGEEYARRFGVASLHPMAGEVQSADVERARAAGIATHAWTLVAEFWPVDELTQLREATAAGVDAVTVSDPALIDVAKEIAQ